MTRARATGGDKGEVEVEGEGGSGKGEVEDEGDSGKGVRGATGTRKASKGKGEVEV